MDDPERDDDETRFKALCRGAAEAWLGPLQEVVISWCVERGLLQIRARAKGFSRLHDDPEARRVFARVGLLDLMGDVADVRALLALPDWLTLSTLDLGCNRLSGVEAGFLAESPDLARLSSLLLYDNEIDDWGATRLARSPHVARLRALDLRRNKIESGGALALAASPYLHPAVQLDLEGNSF